MTHLQDLSGSLAGDPGVPGGPIDVAGARIACTNLTVRFGGLIAVSDVDLSVPPDSIVGLVGPNGAGKSTLFGVLSGLLRPSKGRVFIDGVDVTSSGPQARAHRGLARTFQHPEIFVGLSVEEHLVLAYRVRHARSRVWSDLFTLGSLRPSSAEEKAAVGELLDALGLRPVAKRPAEGLPLGVCRLLELGRALATAPSVLLLDEPSSGLDSGETGELERTLSRIARDRSISVLLVEHDVDLVMRMCDVVNVLDFGILIASGTPEEVRADPKVRSAYLGEEAEVVGPEPGGEPERAPEVAGDVPEPAGAPERGAEAAPLVVSGAVHPHHAVVEPGAPLLVVEDLCVRYGDAIALSGASFVLEKGKALAVLGPNGAGKSSLARAVSGLVRPASGRIVLAGADIGSLPAYRVRRAGVVHLPEGRGVFRNLTVVENLKMGVSTLGREDRQAGIERALEIFPMLREHRRQLAATLSGGEQQMLSLARALALQPELIIADELSLGLAPKLVDAVFEGLERAVDAGVTVLMIEQYVHRALAFADEALVLQRGAVVWSGPRSEATGDLLHHYLGELSDPATPLP